MRKILIFICLLITIGVAGQVTPKTPFNIPDNNTAFGINLPEGSYIYDAATDSVWVLNAVATTTTTLRTATKSLLYPRPVPNFDDLSDVLFSEITPLIDGDIPIYTTGLGWMATNLYALYGLLLTFSDTTDLIATQYWVGEQGYLTNEVDGVVGNEGDTIKHHIAGYGLDGTFYNQTANQVWKVDTNELATPYYVKDAIHDSLTNLYFNDLSDVNITGADQGDIPMLNETNQWINYTPTWLTAEVDGNIGNEGDTTAHLTNGFGILNLDYNQTSDDIAEVDTTKIATKNYVLSFRKGSNIDIDNSGYVDSDDAALFSNSLYTYSLSLDSINRLDVSGNGTLDAMDLAMIAAATGITNGDDVVSDSIRGYVKTSGWNFGSLGDSAFLLNQRFFVKPSSNPIITNIPSGFIPIFDTTDINIRLGNEFNAGFIVPNNFGMSLVSKENFIQSLGTDLEINADTSNWALDADKLDGQHGSYYLDNTDEQEIEYTSPLYGYNDHGLLSITNGTGASIYTFGAGIDPTYGGLVPPNNNLGSGYFLNANGDWAEISSGFVGTATSDLNMADYNIDNVDSLEVEEDLIVNGSILINTEKWLDQFRKQPYYYTDCWNSATNYFVPFSPGAINSGTYTAGAISENHPGTVKFTSSTTNNSGYTILLSNNTTPGLGKGEVTEYIVKFIQFDSTTTYCGFIDATSSESVDGAYFHISTSGIATGKTASNSSRTSTSTTYTLSLGTWYRFKVKVSSSTRADFYIYNDSETQLWTDYITTNIPGTSRATGGGGIVSTKTTSGTGGNKDLIQIDYISSYFGVLTR